MRTMKKIVDILGLGLTAASLYIRFVVEDMLGKD